MNNQLAMFLMWLHMICKFDLIITQMSLSDKRIGYIVETLKNQCNQTSSLFVERIKGEVGQIINFMKTKIFNGSLYLIFIYSILLISCKSQCNCSSIDKTSKEGIILFKICKYINDNKLNVKPANPCEYKIIDIKHDTLNGVPINKVFLNCCYFGDQVWFDKSMNKIIRFIPSDK